tara:strand:+ start:593 stop:874 length:282 start_codon:yes stop_codon:yes gene_type:complete
MPIPVARSGAPSLAARDNSHLTRIRKIKSIRLLAGVFAMVATLPALAAEGDPVCNYILMEAGIAEIDAAAFVSKAEKSVQHSARQETSCLPSA